MLDDFVFVGRVVDVKHQHSSKNNKEARKMLRQVLLLLSYIYDILNTHSSITAIPSLSDSLLLAQGENE